MAFMNRILNIILGALSLMWYSITFPVLFDYLFIDVSLEPVIGPCRELYDIDSCRPLARLLLWTMELPLNIVIFCSFSLLIVLLEKKVQRVRLKYFELTLGVILGYAIIMFVYSGSIVHISYYIVALITYASLLIFGIWVFSHLTSKGTGREKDAPVL